MDVLRVGVAQIPQTNDIETNRDKIIEYLHLSGNKGVDVLCFPEAQTQGYRVDIVEYDVPVGDITLHLVFIETKSDENPVMTVTYLSSNNTQIIEKGWIAGMTYNSYTVLVTEEFAVENLKNYGDCKQFVKALIQNYDGDIKLIKE